MNHAVINERTPIRPGPPRPTTIAILSFSVKPIFPESEGGGVGVPVVEGIVVGVERLLGSTISTW
jgi:hypothetical protein